jgi:hypothetical protein
MLGSSATVFSVSFLAIPIVDAVASESVESVESVKHAPQSDDLTNDSNEDETEQSLKEPATYKITTDERLSSL